MYVMPNFSTKKELTYAVQQQLPVKVFSPGPFPAKRNGTEYVEGPHYPKPHKWYAKVEVQHGLVIKVYK